MREVKTFASLNHINIVPYNQCWLEPLISYENDKRVTVDEDSRWMSNSESDNIRITKSAEDSLRLHQTNDSFSINFEYSENHKSTVTDASRTSSSSSSVATHTQKNSVGSLEQIRRLNISNASSVSKAVIVPHVTLSWSVLYIQMKLCQKTLRNFLDERNSHECFELYYESYNIRTDNNTLSALSIFQQVCNGLEYIHARNIVHHDVKPQNIFVSFENSVALFQLGDFGLSCPLDGNELISHDGIGTRLYAASEQLNGLCHPKSDLYSMGIILIELLLNCTTVMECFKKVEKIKKGENVQGEIELNILKHIKRLLNKKVEERPDIIELGEIIRSLLDERSEEINRLKNIIDDKNKQIDDLMEEIKNLKSKLNS